MRVRELVVCLAMARVASAQPSDEAHEFSPASRAHFDAGQRHFDAKEYDAAIAEFRAGFAIDHDPYWFYVEAQVERVEALAGKLDKCREAIVNYRKFLESNPPVEDAQTATHNAGRCQLDLSKQPEKVVVKVVKPPQREQDPWFHDTLGVALAGGGIVAAGVGGGALWFAHEHANRAQVAKPLGAYVQEAQATDRDRWIGIIAGATGGALLIAGAIHIVLRPDHEVVVAPTATSQSAGLSIVGSF